MPAGGERLKNRTRVHINVVTSAPGSTESASPLPCCECELSCLRVVRSHTKFSTKFSTKFRTLVLRLHGRVTPCGWLVCCMYPILI